MHHTQCAHRQHAARSMVRTFPPNMLVWHKLWHNLADKLPVWRNLWQASKTYLPTKHAADTAHQTLPCFEQASSSVCGHEL